MLSTLFKKQQAAVSSWTTCMLSTLFENSKRQSLHGQLVCYQHFRKTASGSFFTSILYVSIFERQQVTAYLLEQLVCYCTLENGKWRSLHEQLVRKTESGSFFMSILYVSIFGRQQVAAYLLEQLVCYCSLENGKWRSLHEQLVRKTASGGLFMSSLYGKRQVAVSSWAACTLVFLENSKWKLLYLSNLCIPNNNANGIPLEKSCGEVCILSFSSDILVKEECVTLLDVIQKSEMFISSLSTDVNQFFSSLSADVNHFPSPVLVLM